MRSMVEGACGGSEKYKTTYKRCGRTPSTTLLRRVVPLPRCAGQDEGCDRAYPTSAAMVTAAPSVTSAAEIHNTPIRSHTGRGWPSEVAAWPGGDWLQASSDGSARRNTSVARSIAAMSRASWSRSAGASGPGSSTPGRSGPVGAASKPGQVGQRLIGLGLIRSGRWDELGTHGTEPLAPQNLAPFESLPDPSRPRDIHRPLTLTAAPARPIYRRNGDASRRAAAPCGLAAPPLSRFAVFGDFFPGLSVLCKSMKD